MNKSDESSSVMDIKIINTDEERKIFGELLSNKTSREIMNILVNNEMYANEIGPKLNLTHKLVHHHLNKIKDINLVHVTLKKITKEGEEHKFFKIVCSRVVVNLKETKGVDKEEFALVNLKETFDKGRLEKIFRPVVRFLGFAITATFLWMLNSDDDGIDTDTFESEQLILPMVFIIFALISELVWAYRKKKKD